MVNVVTSEAFGEKFEISSHKQNEIIYSLCIMLSSVVNNQNGKYSVNLIESYYNIISWWKWAFLQTTAGGLVG